MNLSSRLSENVSTEPETSTNSHKSSSSSSEKFPVNPTNVAVQKEAPVQDFENENGETSVKNDSAPVNTLVNNIPESEKDTRSITALIMTSAFIVLLVTFFIFFILARKRL